MFGPFDIVIVSGQSPNGIVGPSYKKTLCGQVLVFFGDLDTMPSNVVAFDMMLAKGNLLRVLAFVFARRIFLFIGSFGQVSQSNIALPKFATDACNAPGFLMNMKVLLPRRVLFNRPPRVAGFRRLDHLSLSSIELARLTNLTSGRSLSLEGSDLR